MKKTNFEDVIAFNQKVIHLTPSTEGLLTPDRFKWFQGVINEELGEMQTALEKRSRVDAVDAVIDLMYFAYGRLYEMGVTAEQFQKCWDIVQNANMAKVRGNKGRGSDADAIKPADWVSPEEQMAKVLQWSTPTDAVCIKCNNLYDYEKCSECGEHGNTEIPSHFVPREELPFDPTPGAINIMPTDRQDLPNSKGRKFDNGKLPVGRFLRDFKAAILEVTKIWAFGAEKYAEGDWKFLEDGERRYADAEIRHFLEGDTIDPESKILHAAHKAWNALAELSFIIKKNGGEI